MGGCTSSTAARPRGNLKKALKKKSDDELTRVDSERLQAERLQRQKEEEELTRMIYSEKAALKEITSKLIVKTTSCEELMDLLDAEELLDISLNEASFRAQKQARRKLMKHVAEEKHDWMLYNNADGIQEPHMVHLGLFLQKVTSTLARIEAIKATQAEPHSKSDAQLTMLSRGPEGAVVVAPVTPPSSPRLGRSSSGEGASHLSPASCQASRGRKRIQPENGGRARSRSESPEDRDSLLNQNISPFRTASLDSGGGSEDGLQLPQDAATLAIIEQQRRLEEEYLQSPEARAAQAGGNGGGAADTGEAPPSPPPSPNGSPRSAVSEDTYMPLSPGEGSSSGAASGIGGGGGLGSPAFNDSLAVGASLALRLGELISPEDDKLLRRVRPGISGILENVRSSKSRHVQYTLSNLSVAAQERCREELLNLQICTIAPQSSYELTQANLYDYDLPPGLVTLRVARTILQLYRRGGRLSPKSVHKLLRLAYRSLSGRPNTSYLTVEPGDTLTVVGDLHGQLPDLLHILEVSGLPGRHNKYIFNGDFVDRGAYGVEVMCTLLALHVALPEHVILNRGNHEDYAICTAYGFQMECCEKYGDVIFGLFVEIFQQLPLFTIVNKAMIVVHGGLFHTQDASLEELNSIDRCAFSLQDLPEGGETLQPVPRSQREEYLRQLVRDALWSDPADQEGILTSVRGAGVSFGPDVTRAFLEANNLKFVVRSHECVRSGYDEPYSGEDKGLLCTIFSASDYGGANNAAAILRFRLLEEGETVAEQHPSLKGAVGDDKDASHSNGAQAEGSPGQEGQDPEDVCVSELKLVRETNLCYTVHYYYVDPCFFDEQSGSTMWEHPAASAAACPPPPTPTVDGVHVPRSMSRRLSLESIRSGSQQLDPDNLPRPPSPQRRSQSLSSSAAAALMAAGDFLEDEGDDEHEALRVSDKDCVLFGARTTLRELIVDRLDELRREFQKLDPRHTGVITKFQWMNVMRETMGLHVRWISLMQVLVLDRHFRSAHGKKMVDYEEFLGSFEPSGHGTGGVGSDSVKATDELGGALVEDEFTALLSDNNPRALPPTPKDTQQEQQAPPGSEGEGGHTTTASEVGSPRDDDSTGAPAAAPDTDGAATASPGSDSVPLAYSASPASSGRSPNTGSAARKRVSFLSDGTPDSPDVNDEERSAAPLSVTDTSPRKSVSFAAAPLLPPESTPSNASVAKADARSKKTFHNHEISKELLEVLYIDHKEVESAFAFFDRDDDGFISRDEFRAACRELNKYLPRGQRIRDVEALLQLMDFEETGEIPFNNFFELFRLSEMKLNVAIDEEDTLVGFLHHAGGENNRDLVRRSSVVSMSGFGSFHQPSASGKLEVHGVQINVDSDLAKTHSHSPSSPIRSRSPSGSNARSHSPPPSGAAQGQAEAGSGKEPEKEGEVA